MAINNMLEFLAAVAPLWDKYSMLPVTIWYLVDKLMERAAGQPVLCTIPDGLWLYAGLREIGYPCCLVDPYQDNLPTGIVFTAQADSLTYDLVKAQGLDLVFGYCASGRYPSLLGRGGGAHIASLIRFTLSTLVGDDPTAYSRGTLSDEEKRLLRLTLCQRMRISPKWAECAWGPDKDGLCSPGISMVEQPRPGSDLPKYFVTMCDSTDPRRFKLPSGSVWASLRGVETEYGKYAYLVKLVLDRGQQVAYWYSGQNVQGDVYGVNLLYGAAGAISAKASLIEDIIPVPGDVSKMLAQAASLGVFPIKGGYARIQWPKPGTGAPEGLSVTLVTHGKALRTNMRGVADLLFM